MLEIVETVLAHNNGRTIHACPKTERLEQRPVVKLMGGDADWRASSGGDLGVTVGEAPPSHPPLLNPNGRTPHKSQMKAQYLRLRRKALYNIHGPLFQSATAET